MFQIVDKRVLNNEVVQMVVDAPFIARKAQPGQFIIFKIDQFGERVPLTISDYDRERGTITIVFQIVGKTTRELSLLEVGDGIEDFVGPLGKPSHLSGYKNVCVIGGGLGCAIAFPQAKYLNDNGINVDIIAGFRNKEIVILEDEMRENCRNLYLTTDDGSYVRKGFVTDVLRELVENGKQYDLVVAIGPIVMMKNVCKVTKEFDIHTEVSMNTIMLDGTGMCGACRLTVDGEMKFACIDGPDFDGHKVDFDEAMRRNTMFRKEEREADEHYCHLIGGLRRE